MGAWATSAGPVLHGNTASLASPRPLLPSSRLRAPFPSKGTAASSQRNSPEPHGSHMAGAGRRQRLALPPCREAHITGDANLPTHSALGKGMSQPFTAPIKVFKNACTPAKCTKNQWHCPIMGHLELTVSGSRCSTTHKIKASLRSVNPNSCF